MISNFVVVVAVVVKQKTAPVISYNEQKKNLEQSNRHEYQTKRLKYLLIVILAIFNMYEQQKAHNLVIKLLWAIDAIRR